MTSGSATKWPTKYGPTTRVANSLNVKMRGYALLGVKEVLDHARLRAVEARGGSGLPARRSAASLSSLYVLGA